MKNWDGRIYAIDSLKKSRRSRVFSFRTALPREWRGRSRILLTHSAGRAASRYCVIDEEEKRGTLIFFSRLRVSAMS